MGFESLADRKKKLIRDISLFAFISWPYFLNDFYLVPLTGTNRLDLLWALDIVFYFLVPATTLFVLYRRGLFSPGRIGLNAPPTLVGVLAAIVAALLTHVLITNHLEPWLYAHGCCRTCGGYPTPSAGILKWGAVVYASITAGFLEEIIFRGVLIATLQKYMRQSWVIVIVSCLIFSGIHWCLGSGKLVSTFIMGTLPTIFYLKKRRLSEPIVWHVVLDFLAFL